MVGNISDMQAEMATNATIPTGPAQVIVTKTQTTPATAAEARSRDGLTYFISHVKKNRKRVKATIEARNTSDARLSSAPEHAITYRIVNDHTPVCTPT